MTDRHTLLVCPGPYAIDCLLLELPVEHVAELGIVTHERHGPVHFTDEQEDDDVVECFGTETTYYLETLAIGQLCIDLFDGPERTHVSVDGDSSVWPDELDESMRGLARDVQGAIWSVPVPEFLPDMEEGAYQDACDAWLGTTRTLVLATIRAWAGANGIDVHEAPPHRRAGDVA